MSNIILCADDSKTMQTVAEITFRVSDFQYVGARSADEALEKARAQKPALILADAVMPGKTGYDLCQMIKSDPQLADVPVIVLCGNSEAYDASKGSAVGADGHLAKPWDSQVMLDKCAELVAKGASASAPAAAASPAAAAAPRPGKLNIDKIKAPRLSSSPGIPTPPTPPTPATIKPPNIPSPATASKDAAGARTHTIMGMPTIQPPKPASAAPAKPAAPTKPPAPRRAATPPPLAPRTKTAPPRPATLKPAAPVKPAAPPKPAVTPSAVAGASRRPSTVPSKYAPPSMKSAITKPGAPEPPKPAAQPDTAERSTKAMPAALKPAAPVKPAVPTPPPVVKAKPAAPPPVAKAKPAPVVTPAATPPTPASAAPTTTPTAAQPLGRPPMIRGIPTRQPAFIAPAALRQVDAASVTRAAVARAAADVGIAADGPEVKALLALSHDVVERLIWEIVPDLAEAIIRENLDTLAAKR